MLVEWLQLPKLVMWWLKVPESLVCAIIGCSMLQTALCVLAKQRNIPCPSITCCQRLLGSLEGAFSRWSRVPIVVQNVNLLRLQLLSSFRVCSTFQLIDQQCGYCCNVLSNLASTSYGGCSHHSSVSKIGLIGDRKSRRRDGFESSW